MASAAIAVGERRDAARPRRDGWGGTASLMLMLALVVLAVPLVGIATGRWRFVPIRSGSMSPSFPTGSQAVAVPLPLPRLKVGDVLVYRIPVRDHRLIAHRIVRVVRAGNRPIVLTKGDANRAPDPWRARLHGSPAWVVRGEIPVVGYASMFARSLAPLLGASALAAIGVASAMQLIWRDRQGGLALGDDEHVGLRA